jgi:hypothetical protein
LVNGFIDHHDSELQAMTALPLLYKLYKSLEHKLSLFICYVFTSRSLVTSSNTGDSSVFAITPLSAGVYLTTKLIAPTVLVLTSRHGPHKKHLVSKNNSIVACLFFPREGVYRAVAQKRSGLYTTIL